MPGKQKLLKPQWLQEAEVSLMLGNHQKAFQLCYAYLQTNPRDGQAWAWWVQQQMKLGQNQETLKTLQQGLACCPQFGLLWHLKGVVLCQQQQYSEGLEAFRRAIDCGWRQSETFYNMGLTYKNLGRYTEAISVFQKAQELSPEIVQIDVDLAQTYQLDKKIKKALAVVSGALAKAPSPPLYVLQGQLYEQQEDPLKALESYQKAQEMEPTAEVAFKMGCCYQYPQIENYIEARNCFSESIRLDENYQEAYVPLVELLTYTRNFKDAFKRLDQACVLFPNDPDLLNSLVATKYAACDWRNLKKLEQELMVGVTEQLRLGQRSRLKPFQAVGRGLTPELQHAIAKAEAKHRFSQITPWRDIASKAESEQPELKPVSPVKIGYLSSSFGECAATFNILPLLRGHRREYFTVYGYALDVDDHSSARHDVQQACDVFCDLSEMRTEDIVSKIREEKLTVLVVLMGYGPNARLDILAARVAPYQILYQSYAGTLGALLCDHLIADEVVLPPAERRYYAEKALYLNRPYYAVDPEVPEECSASALTRADVGLPEKGCVFVCFASTAKIDAVVFQLWMQILTQVPGSVLWLPVDHPDIQNHLKREAKALGVKESRVIFAESLPRMAHLARYRLADFALDTLMCNGNAATLEALKMGIPVLTMYGANWGQRVSASFLKTLGLPELIADTYENYVATAVQYGNQAECLSALKSRLKSALTQSVLFNERHFVCSFETLILKTIGLEFIEKSVTNHADDATDKVLPEDAAGGDRRVAEGLVTEKRLTSQTDNNIPERNILERASVSSKTATEKEVSSDEIVQVKVFPSGPPLPDNEGVL